MSFGGLRRTLAELSARKFDVVHIHTPFLAHYAGLRFAKAQRTPVVATYHTLFEEYLHHYVPLLPRVLGRGLGRCCCSWAAPRTKRTSGSCSR
jgi:glycosyltransferase involved in cell wall biosynthesis